MGWTMMRERGGSESSRELKRAVMMAKEGIERICDLAEEMEEQYGERGSYGLRGYGERYGERYDDYGERRRDSRGRYM